MERQVVRPVKTVVVTAESPERVYRFPARIEAAEEVDLSFRVQGTLVALPVKEGQEVAKGDVVARLDPRDFESSVATVESQLRQARAQLRAMQVGEREEDIRALQAQVTAAEAQYTEAELNFQRYATLYGDKVVSKMEYDNALASRDVARAQLDTARQNLEKGRKGSREEDLEAQRSMIAGLQSQLKQVRDALGDATLHAPFGGRIALVHVENHQDVAAKQPVAKLQNLTDAVKISFDMPEHLVLGNHRDGTTLAVSFESLPQRSFPAMAVEIASEADAQTGTFAVTAIMPSVPDITILPGMTAVVTARQPVVRNTSSHWLPQSAVFGQGGNASAVWVVDDKAMTVTRRGVELGRLRGDRVEVVGGVAPGERLVSAGVHYLEEGQAVRLLQTPHVEE